MAAPTIVSASSTTAASNTTITITAPASISSGNILIAVIGTTNGGGFVLSTPTGWTLLITQATGVVCYYKFATNAEPADYTWTWTGSSVSAGIIIQCTGHSVTAIDVSAGLTNSSSANITAPTVTPRMSPSLLLSIYFTLNATAITVPAGQNNIGGSNANSRAIICGYQTLDNTFATGTITSTGVNVSNNDTVTIGGKVYTFKTALTPTEGEILIGVDSNASLTNLSRAINNSGGTPGTDYQVAAESAWVTCSAVAANVLTLTSIGNGTVGNATTLTEAAVTLSVSGAVLSGAVNGTTATGTRVATSSAAVNYGFNIVLREPNNISTILPGEDISRTNYTNSPVIGIGGGMQLLSATTSRSYGLYKIEGYTRQITTGVTLARYAILLNMQGYPIYGQRTQISSSGFFSFKNLAPGNYIVMGIDESGVQNGVIAAKITAVAM